MFQSQTASLESEAAMRFRYLALVVAGAVITIGLPFSSAIAGTATTSFLVTANVNANCIIDANDLDFGDYNPVGGALDGQSQISVTCLKTTQWNVGLNAGTAAGATVTTRKMTGPGAFLLAYGLFSDATRTTNWGQTVGTDTVSGTGTGAAQIVTVYGRIPASQNVGIGGYVDTITATIAF